MPVSRSPLKAQLLPARGYYAHKIPRKIEHGAEQFVGVYHLNGLLSLAAAGKLSCVQVITSMCQHSK